MFKKTDFSNEIATSMEGSLIKNAHKQISADFDKAMDCLNAAASIFDDLGLMKEAEATTRLLEVVAAKKKKKPKTKSKSIEKPKDTTKKKAPAKTKKTDKATSGLTSEKMVDNLKEKGWVFNVDDLSLTDDHEDECDCSMCDDTNYSWDLNDQDMMEEWEDEVETPDFGGNKARRDSW
jgi:hypothetical protein